MSHSNIQTGAKCVEARTHDFLYDPVFTLPTEKDQLKHAQKASLATAQYEVSPIFRSMFSDLPNYPSRQIVIRKDLCELPIHQNVHNRTKPLMDVTTSLQELCLQSKSVDVVGFDRTKFFKSPIITLSPDMIPGPKQNLETEQMKSVKSSKNRCIQTKYRESSAQTTPWKPEDYIITDGSDPEILKLNFLKENLPAGMHEVDIIKHARKQRGWERLLPEIEDAASLEKRRQILEAIETDRWVFREQEIMHLQNLRYELLEKMLQEIHDRTNDEAEKKLKRTLTRLQNERETKQVKALQKKHRELRRLKRKHASVVTHYHKLSVINEYSQYRSELYAPLLRCGENPKRKSLRIDLSTYEPRFLNVDKMNVLPRWIKQGTQIQENSIKLPGRRLCIRETKWTEPVLKQLHQELKMLRTSTKFKCTLLRRIVKKEGLDKTLQEEGIPDSDKLQYDAALLLQSVIRGRATQTLVHVQERTIYEGRDRCREAIKELQQTHALVSTDADTLKLKRIETMTQNRRAQIADLIERNIEESLNKLQSSVVGTLLDFLNKELIRLLDERKAHALALLYERDRRDKEAAEAGRRQLEEKRRKEHDEMFKQTMKIHQETVDVYLRNIVLEGVEHQSDEKAKEYVRVLTEQIDKNPERNNPKTFIEKEELIADMIHHFVIPEVERCRMREQIKKRQQKFLSAAHEAIYNKIETIPTNAKEIIVNKCSDESSEEMELPKLSDSSEAEEKSNGTCECMKLSQATNSDYSFCDF